MPPDIPPGLSAATEGASSYGRFAGVTASAAPTTGTYGVGDFVLTRSGQMFVCTAAGTPGTWANPQYTADMLTTGEESLRRDALTSTAVAAVSGTMPFAYFTARRTEATTQVRMITGGTAAGATPTIARIGLYSVASSGALTLVASTANDTALFDTSAHVYTKSWSAPYLKVAGQRYAVAPLVVSGATMPTFCGAVAANAAEATLAPAVAGGLTGQTDLPSTVTAASLADSAQRPYAVILP